MFSTYNLGLLLRRLVEPLGLQLVSTRFMVCVELIPPPFLAPGHDAGALLTTLGFGNVLLHGGDILFGVKRLLL